MATRKDRAEEKLDDASIERVIKLLEPTDGSKPCTKKDACAILNISYNTTRLGTVIEQYKVKKERNAARRASLRGKPASADEIRYMIEEYLNGEAITNISESSHRSVDFVRRVLEANSVPMRANAHDYFKPELIPDGAMRERFTVGEMVYSARYDSIAKIEGEQAHKDGWVYRIWLTSEKWKQFAYQEAAQLASLEHLTKLGIKF